MGIIQVPGRLSGRTYNIEIEGDAPTAAEQARILAGVEERENRFVQRYEATMGKPLVGPDDGTAVGRGLERGKATAKSLLGTTVETIGQQVGLPSIAEYGRGMEEAAARRQLELSLLQPAPTTRQDVAEAEGFFPTIGAGLTYAGELAGEQLPQLGVGLAGGAAGAVAGGLTAGPAGALAGFGIGSGLTEAPMLFGSNVQRQEEEVAAGRKAAVDLTDALSSTVGQAGLTAVTNALAGAGVFVRPGAKLFTRALSGATVGGTTESLNEVGQQMLERYQAGLPIDSPEAIQEYIDAGVAGGVLGFGAGGIGGAVGGPRPTEAPEAITPAAPAAEPTVTQPAATPEEIAAAAQEVAVTPTLAEGQEQGELFAGLPAQTVPARTAPTVTQPTSAEEQLSLDFAGTPREDLAPMETEEEAFERAAKLAAPEEKTPETHTAVPMPEAPVLTGQKEVQVDTPVSTMPARIPFGPTTLKPKPIGGTLYSDMSPESLNRLLSDMLGNTAKGAVVPRWFSDNKNLALGQGANTGVVVEFDGNYVSGAESRSKPGIVSGVVEGREFQSDYINENAIRSFTLPPGQKLQGVARKFMGQMFDETVSEDGSRTYTKKTSPMQEASNVTETAAAKPEEVGAGVPSGGQGVEGGGGPADIAAGPAGAETPAGGGLGGDLPLPVDTAATAGAEPTPLIEAPTAYAPMSGAAPGTTTKTAGQAIPAPVRVPQAQTMSPVQRATAQQLDQALAARYEAMTPPDVKRGAKFLNERGVQGTISDKLTIADKQVVANLLATRDDLLSPQGKAAKLYFSKVARPMEAVLMVVDDLTAPYGKYRAEPGTDPFTRAFLAQTGTVAAKQALDFIKTRMSKELNREVTFRQDLSAQQNKNIETWVADLDRVELKRAERLREREARIEAAKESGYVDGAQINAMTAANPLAALDKDMHYSVKMALDAGDLRGALLAVAATTNNVDLKALAAKFADLIGTTRVQVLYEGDSAEYIGRDRAVFVQQAEGVDPEYENIILINGYTGMTTHVLMHEMAHAVTSRLLVTQPNHPVSKQLIQLLLSLRDAAPRGVTYEEGDFYGLSNVSEMVAEAFGRLALGENDNGLRDLMKRTPYTKYTTVTNELPLTNWERFKEVLGNFMRGLIGRPAKPYPRRTAKSTIETQENGLDRFHRLIDGLLSEAPQVLPAYVLDKTRISPMTAKSVLNNAIQNAQPWNKAGRNRLSNQMQASIPNALRRALLGLLHLDWFNDLAGKYFPQIAALKQIDDERRGEIIRMADKAKPVLQDLQAYSEKQPGLFSQLMALMGRATVEEVDPTKPRATYKANPEKLRVWDELTRELNTSDSTGEMQTLFKKVRNMYKGYRDEIANVLRERVREISDDVATQNQLFARLMAKIDEEGVIDPYFSLMRRGDFWLSYTAEDTTAAAVSVDPVTGVSKRPPTQFVQAFESVWERQQFIDKLRATKDAQGNDVAWDFEEYPRPRTYNPDSNVPSAFVQGAINIINTTVPDTKDAAAKERADAAISAIQDMFVRFTPEHSLMKSFTKRKGTRGFVGDITPLGVVDRPADMVQLLAEKSSGLAYQLSNMKYGARIQKLRNGAQAEYKRLMDSNSLTAGEQAAVLAYLEEFDDRAQFAQKPEISQVAQLTRGVTFGMTLGFNVAGALNTFAQIPMIGTTELGGRYGMAGALREIGSAARLVMNAGKTYKVRSYGADGMETRELDGVDNFGSMANYFEVDDAGKYTPRTDKKIPSKLRSKIADLDVLVEVMSANGMLANSMAQEMLEADAGWLHKINRWSGFMQHHGERFNRQVMAIAAYNLELGKVKSGGGDLSYEAKLAAAKKAVEITERVNGSIGASTAPRWAQGAVGSVVFMFKRFGLHMARYIIGTANQAIRGMSKEDRAVARYQIIGMLGTTALFAGVQGLPFFGELMSIFNLLFTEDDEEPAEVVMQKFLGEPYYNGALNYLTGAEIASRISMSGLIFRENRIEKDQSIAYDLFEMLGGPAVGVFMNVERGVELLSQGEMYRGVEAMMPSAVKSVMKSVRFGTEGATTLRGNEVVPVSNWDLALQMVGYTPGAYARQQERVSGEKRIDKAIVSERRSLLLKYNTAFAEGDFETVREVLKDMFEFSKRHPTAAITADTLERSGRSFSQRTSEMIGGVTFTPSYLPRAQKSISEYDQDISFWGSE